MRNFFAGKITSYLTSRDFLIPRESITIHGSRMEQGLFRSTLELVLSKHGVIWGQRSVDTKKVFFEDVNGKNLDLDLEQAVG